MLPTHCLVGAVQDWFWGGSGADHALGFCAKVEADYRRSCPLA
jgi:hypothetical protein